MTPGSRRIAVVGVACRYPDAAGPDRLWQTVMARRAAFRRMPSERLPLADYGGDGADQTYVTHAALLTGWHFDRQRFRVAGPAFRAADTAHWLALDMSAAALADAGFPDGDGLDAGRVGVILGNSLTGEFSRAAALRTRWPYVRRTVLAALAESPLGPDERAALLRAVERRYKEPFPAPTDETLAGALSNTIAGRICNHFDFHGTGYTVDGACASSLLAVSHAADAVAAGRLDVALAGGVDLSLDPFELVGFARAGALARDEMRVYDRRPTGFLPGEGCGLVVLCREDFAVRHGLRVYAYLLGWATSSDGHGGLIRPEAAGQLLALRRAYEHARLDPAEAALIEGHGTGTEVGDGTELRALLEVRGRTPRRAALGSVKANIGHTKAAAGVAGLLKAVLAVHRGVLPPTTGCPEPHPLLSGPEASLTILDEARPWPAGERYAGVSAMGFGGINAHVVLGGPGGAGRRLHPAERHLAGRHPSHEVIVCTGADRRALAAKLTSIRDAAAAMSRAELGDLGAGLARTEPPDAPVRFAAVVASPGELAAAAEHALTRLAAGEPEIIDPARRLFLAEGRLRVALLFPGQAAPCYPDAGALGDLLDEVPAAYADPLPVATPPAGPVGTAVAQPAILRATLAGLRWLDALGVEADEAVGHSLGELAALVWAGTLDEDEAYGLARTRGAAMAQADPVSGGMAALEATEDDLTPLLAGTDVVVAADNGPRRLVVSGDRAQLRRVLDRAAAAGIRAGLLPVAHAFHSPAMAGAAYRLKEAAAAVPWRPAQRRFVSTVTGDWFAAEDAVELLVRQLTAPVRFRQAMQRCRSGLFVEVGPGHLLTGLTGGRAVAMDAGSPSAAGVATVTAALFAAGRCGTVVPWYARRFTRPFELGHRPDVLVGACETAVPEVDPAAVDDTGQEPADTVRPRPVDQDAEPLAATVAAVADACELDPAAVPSDARLLADLHLSSLLVGRLAGDVATRLGRALPAAPLSLATATVAELAEVVAALPAADTAEPPVAGVAGWVRAFAPRRLAEPLPAGPEVPRTWEIVGDLDRHPLGTAIREAFRDEPGGTPTRLIALPPGLDATPLPELVSALRRGIADGLPVVVLHHGGVGAAVGRSLAAERPGAAVLVVETTPDEHGIALAAAEARRPAGDYAEAGYDADGARTVPVLGALVAPDGGPLPVGARELCVVTGGAKGIGAECAVALAAATGAHLALLGRSPESDEAVRTTLRRVADAGSPVTYHRVDVADTAAVKATMATLQREHGPVRMLLHAAGINVPVRIPDLTPDALAQAVSAKVTGFDTVLAAIDLPRLRCAVAFSSLIARIGLPGEAHYALANEWLARRCADLAVTEPGVRWLAVEWSAWSGAGMGVGLGVLDNLSRQGLSPIPPEEATAWLLRLLAGTTPPVVVVAGRIPAAPTLRWYDGGGAPGGRFLAEPLTATPGVEVVAGAGLSLGTDPYLDHHRIDGTVVLPAVFGLEAMAQAAAVVQRDAPRVFHDVALTRPVTVPERDPRTLRTAALAREDGTVDVALRSDETGFATDHFRARYGGMALDPADPHPGEPLTGPLLSARHLYGPLFFHGPRFRRVTGYPAVAARRCAAVVDADPQGRWFGEFLDQRLELGDPGARDAFLHLLQVCVPGRRVLPTGAGQVRMIRRPQGRLTVHARQRAESDDGYVFDLLVLDAGGTPVEQWSGLVLRALRAVEPEPWPVEVVGALLARELSRWPAYREVDLAVARGDRDDPGRTAAVAAWLAGAPATHAADGRLVVAGPGTVSASHLGPYVLVGTGPGRVAVDWEAVGEPPAPLGAADRELADQLARLGGTDAHSAGYRVWTAREALAKLGRPAGEPLLLTDDPGTLASGRYTLAGRVLDTTAGRIAICAGVGELP
ncbi:SDR family NAD(P)-dependent oxidoreductase [Nucisporomicrobium flavum]|uniref:SDR family NAD(P)-dependent oxidoreductase n=1 Tax=Nucisporomicrobium flavum TaxID=2785915 RepID=UPI003C2DF8B2